MSRFPFPACRLPALSLVCLLAFLPGCVRHIAEPVITPSAGPEAPAGFQPFPDLEVCWVEFATGVLPHGASVAHHALKVDVPSTQSGLLLKSPLGNWLIDGGQSSVLELELQEVHGLRGFLLHQAARGWTLRSTPADAVRSNGADPSTLAGVIPTHGHFDHLGGLLDLRGVPVVLPQAEIDLANEVIAGGGFGILPAEARALVPRAQAVTFDGGPFLEWSQSHDLFGDGSVVLFPLEGHTPGSLGVRVRLPDSRELLLVGDTVWVREGYEQREPKGWIAQPFDADHAALDAQIQKLWSLHKARPDLHILPAHDRRAWVEALGQPGCVR